MRIYVADDEKITLENEIKVIRSVSPEGEIRGFRSGEELLEAAKKEPCEIAFLDIHMKELQGVDTAAKLKEISPRVNIIFATAREGFYKNAMEMHASGYILKPLEASNVRREIQDLRYEKKTEKNALLKVFCFGNFDVRTAGDERLHFERSRAKEAFAYLVHLQGKPCNLRELAAALFEDEPFDRKNQLYIQKILSSLMKTLRQYGVEEAVEKDFNSLSVKADLLDCDYYNWIDEGNSRYSVPENYMEQYPWALY